MKNSKAIRSIVFSLIYYSLNIVAIFYLKNKPEILNWDILLVFLPLLVLGFSSETMIKNKVNIELYQFGVTDFILKILAFICSQVIYRHIFIGVWIWIIFSLVIVLFIASIYCSIKMIIISKNKQK